MKLASTTLFHSNLKNLLKMNENLKELWLALNSLVFLKSNNLLENTDSHRIKKMNEDALVKECKQYVVVYANKSKW